MTVKDTLRNDLLLYPYLFKNALDVMVHLFCTSGNGYEWEDGELVPCGGWIESDAKWRIVYPLEAVEKSVHIHMDNHPGTLLTATLIRKEISEGKDTVESVKQRVAELTDRTRDRILSDIDLIRRIDERVEDMDIPSECGRYDDFIYHQPNYRWEIQPLGQYARICEIPDDVQSEWLDAAYEMYRFMEDNPDRIASTSYQEEHLKCMEKVKVRIEEIREQRRKEYEISPTYEVTKFSTFDGTELHA